MTHVAIAFVNPRRNHKIMTKNLYATAACKTWPLGENIGSERHIPCEVYAPALRHHSLTLLFLGWQIIPLALLDGLTDKAAERPLSALSSGANAARQGMHASHIGAAGVLGEASRHDIEGCELQYMVCNTLPWQYVANQAWMG